MAATPTKTPNSQEEQNAAHNPSQENYEAKFNRVTNGYTSTSEDLQKLEDYANNAGTIDADEGSMSGISAGIDQAEAYANDPANNIKKTREKEQEQPWANNVTGNNGPGKKQAKGKFSMAKKAGPFSLIGIILGITGLGGFFGTTLLPVAITEPFINDTNDVNSAQQRHGLHLFGSNLAGDKKKLGKKMSLCKGPVTIRCSFNTLDEKTAQRFKDKGFELQGETTENGRVGFEKLKFPDGTVASNMKELNAALKNPATASAFNSVNSLKNKLFVVGKFIFSALKKVGVNKAKKIKGNNKDEVDKSYEAASKGSTSGEGDLSTKAEDKNVDQNASNDAKKAAEAANNGGSELSNSINDAIKKGVKVTKVPIKLSNAIAIPQLLCLSYNMVNVINITAKTIKAARLANFAMIFLTLAASIKAGKATQPEVEKAASILSPSSYPTRIEDPATGQMIDNPNIGKTATDAEAYKVVAYGDSINLSDITKRFFVGGGILGVMDTVITWINNHIGRANIKTTCKIVNSTAATIIGFLAAPVFSVIVEGITAFLPIDEWIAGLVNMAIEAAAGADLTTNITGVDAGNVLFIGTASIMGMISMKYGLKPGKVSAIKANLGAPLRQMFLLTTS